MDTDSGGEARARLASIGADSQVRFEVEDSGPGISPRIANASSFPSCNWGSAPRKPGPDGVGHLQQLSISWEARLA